MPGTILPDDFMLTCTCCKTAYTMREFKELPFIGDQITEGYALELRNCSCGSTHGMWRNSKSQYITDPFESEDDAFINL